jgi:hypothetical protein
MADQILIANIKAQKKSPLKMQGTLNGDIEEKKNFHISAYFLQ